MAGKTVYEIRSVGGDAAPKIDGEGRTIEGYAIVFGVESQVMVDFWSDERFIEIIDKSSVTEELLRRCDIKALMEHNRERLLARNNRGSGTLELTIDDKGLKYRFEAPNTQEGNDALELIRRGDIGGSSFAFIARSAGCVEKEWLSDKKMWRRTIKRFDGIFDVTITSDPAYLQTSVDARSLAAPEPEDDPDMSSYYEELEKRVKKRR